MIKVISTNVNNFDKNNLKTNTNYSSNESNSTYVQNFIPIFEDLTSDTCPKCGAKHSLKKHGGYHRNITFLVGNSTVYVNVYIHRVICESCNKTQALLPSFVAPYKIYSLSTIIELFAEVSKTSAYQVSQKFDISFQSLYSLTSCVKSFFFMFKLLNNSISVFKEEFNNSFFVNNISKLTEEAFFRMHHWFVFMSKFKDYSNLPVTLAFR